MPRGRGGARQGKTGTAYRQRSDLNAVKTLPATAATGQGYGQATEQIQSQAVVPMASGEVPAAPDAMGDAQAFNPPPVIPIGAESQRPDEHVLSGVGQTPPSMNPAVPGGDPLLRGVAILNALGDDASPQVKALRAAVSAAQANAAAP